jgi:hypothetical protein
MEITKRHGDTEKNIKLITWLLCSVPPCLCGDPCLRTCGRAQIPASIGYMTPQLIDAPLRDPEVRGRRRQMYHRPSMIAFDQDPYNDSNLSAFA